MSLTEAGTAFSDGAGSRFAGSLLGSSRLGVSRFVASRLGVSRSVCSDLGLLAADATGSVSVATELAAVAAAMAVRADLTFLSPTWLSL